MSNDFKKIILNTVKLNLIVGKSIDSLSFLSSMLGQIQINSKDFCLKFDKLSLEKFNIGLEIKVILFKFSDKTTNIIIKTPSLKYLFFSVFSGKEDWYKQDLKNNLVYDVIILNSRFFNISKIESSKLIFSFLKSFNSLIIK